MKQQVENQLEKGENVVFDVDVKGGCNIKQYFGDRALSLFIQPPSIDELRHRLTSRGTDAPEVIEDRLDRAAFELTFAPKFDRVVVNDNLEKAEQEALSIVQASLAVRLILSIRVMSAWAASCCSWQVWTKCGLWYRRRTL